MYPAGSVQTGLISMLQHQQPHNRHKKLHILRKGMPVQFKLHEEFKISL